MKTYRCCNCKQDLPRSAYHPGSYKLENRTRGGVRSACKKCLRDRYLKRLYGLSSKDFKKLLKAQRGVCAICGGPPNGRWKRLHVDHDRVTGQVRGLLCFKCNASLGHFERNRQRFEEYLGLAR
jgi:hypothetical protein